MRIFSVLLTLIIVLGYMSCADNSTPKIDPEPKVLSDTVFNCGLIGMSGICYNKDRTAFLVVCDNGRLYEVGFEGQIIRTLPYSGGNDFEGITMNYATGAIYLVDEKTMQVVQLINETSLSPIVTVDIPSVQSNKGLEGIAYGCDTLYIVNQESPLLMVKYSLVSEQEISRKTLTNGAFLSDICFDATDNTLWIVDSKMKIVTHRDLSGRVLDYQYIEQVQKAEAILVDRQKGFMWIGCDQTGKIFRLKIKI